MDMNTGDKAHIAKLIAAREGRVQAAQKSEKKSVLPENKGGLRYKAAEIPKDYHNMTHEEKVGYYNKNKGSMVSAKVNPKTGKYFNTQ